MPTTLRHAWRALYARPILTLGVVITLALGIGANVAMLGVLDALLVRAPAHVVDARHVARVYLARRDPGTGRDGVTMLTSYPFFAALRARARSVADVAAVADDEWAVHAADLAERLPGRAVSSNFFALLGVRPTLGRFFGRVDDARDATPTVVLGDAFWRRAFGGDPAVLGRTIRVGALRARVVGVAPAAFAGIDFARVDVWLPLMAARGDWGGDEALTNNTTSFLRLVVRPRRGVSDARVGAEAGVIYRDADAAAEHPDAAGAAATRVLMGPIQAARGPDAGDARRLPLWLALMSAALLVAAAANATGLLLARALERRRAVAVRRALGARGRDLARDVAAEAVVLAGGSALFATAMAAALGAAVRRWVLGDAFATLPALDARRLVLVAIVAVVTCLAAAFVAAGVAARGANAPAVLRGTESRGATRADGRALGALVTGQVALTFVLLVGAGLFAGSLRRALGERIGFDLEHVLYVGFDDDGSARRALFARARERLAALSDVRGVAVALLSPLRGAMNVPVRVAGRASSVAGPVYLTVATPDFFTVAGTRLVAGRAPAAPPPPSPSDTVFRGPATLAREVVVSAYTARTLWPGRDPIGACVHLSGNPACAIVVGVAEDTRRFRLVEETAAQLYVSADFQGRLVPNALLVRVRGGTDAAITTVRRTLAATGAGAADVDGSNADVRSLASVFAPNYAPYRAGAGLLSAFGALALTLAAVGLFGVVSYALAQRRREIGVRLALGAPASHVGWLLARGGLGPAAVGLGLGAATSLAGAPVVRALLYGVTPYDPRAALGAAVTLAGAAAVASWVPARRAGRVPPAEVLRAE